MCVLLVEVLKLRGNRAPPPPKDLQTHWLRTNYSNTSEDLEESDDFATEEREEQCPLVPPARLPDNDYLSSSENKNMGGVLRATA